MTEIREWDYDGPGLEATIQDHEVVIRQFDGYGEMRLSVTTPQQAHRLAALLEAFASREDGRYKQARRSHDRFVAKLDAEIEEASR